MRQVEDLTCPKCGSRFTRLDQEGQHIVQVCVCGLRRYLSYVTRHGHEVTHRAVTLAAVTLPAKGSKRYRCLMAVRSGFPGTVTTEYVMRRVRLTSKEASAFMVALMVRGLIDRVLRRKGFPGGSSWRLSYASEKMLVPQVAGEQEARSATEHRR